MFAYVIDIARFGSVERALFQPRLEAVEDQQPRQIWSQWPRTGPLFSIPSSHSNLGTERYRKQ